MGVSGVDGVLKNIDIFTKQILCKEGRCQTLMSYINGL